MKKDIMGIYGQMINTYRKMPDREDAEQIDLNFIDNMKLGSYKKEDDYQAMEGEKNSSVIFITSFRIWSPPFWAFVSIS